MTLISFETVRSHCAMYFGLSVDKVKSLGSCQDINFQIDTASAEGDRGGRRGPRYVVKYANPHTSLAELDFQVRVLRFLAENAEGKADLHFPRPLPTASVPISASVKSLHPASPFIRQVDIEVDDDVEENERDDASKPTKKTLNVYIVSPDLKWFGPLSYAALRPNDTECPVNLSKTSTKKCCLRNESILAVANTALSALQVGIPIKLVWIKRCTFHNGCGIQHGGTIVHNTNYPASIFSSNWNITR